MLLKIRIFDVAAQRDQQRCATNLRLCVSMTLPDQTLAKRQFLAVA